MADILRYRFPGALTVAKTGSFELVSDFEKLNGFVVSDFLMENTYQFIENKEKCTFCFDGNESIIQTKENYLQTADSLIKAIRDESLQKVILSRIIQVEFDEQKSEQLFELLSESYPNAFVYLISGRHFGTWIGATPEILLQSENNNAETISLAGTKEVNDHTDWARKELKEQHYVTEYIVSKLKGLSISKLKISKPSVRFAGPVKHLQTNIRFNADKTSPQMIIKTLHPTPALSGLPQHRAIELIEHYEPHERLLYGGMIGLINHSSCSVYVNLRCMQIQLGTANLYVGGGLTAESNALSEWNETVNKGKTLLNLLQIL